MAHVENSSANRPRPARQRSAVTNNRRLFVGGDDRSAWSRRYRDLILAHMSDLGGVAALSEAQRSLVRRAAGLECELESMEGRLSQGQEVNLDAFGRAASHLRRIFETLGLERKCRDVTPDGVEVLPFSPMRARWAAEAAAKAAKGVTE